MTYTLTLATLYNALQRGGAAPNDGTYSLTPGWIGSARTWTADPVVETDGYEIAYAPVAGWALNGGYIDWGAPTEWAPGMRVGVWTDPATGYVVLDLTMHVRAPFSVALSLGAERNQSAVWDWAHSDSFYVGA